MRTSPPGPTRSSEGSGQAGERFGPFSAIEPLRNRNAWWLAKCRHDNGELVAVKAVRSPDPQAQKTLRQEAALLWQLAMPGHEGVVRIVDQSGASGPFWYAMVWVDGQALDKTRGGELLELPRALRIGHSLASALEYVHSRGVVHGDVSPSNALVDGADHVTLIDFGTAALAFDSSAAREVGHSSTGRHGTPGYLAPERLREGVFDTRADLYSLGCLLFELFTGRPVFHAGDAASLQQQHLQLAPPSPQALRPDLPPGIDALILKLLAKDPARRCASVSEVCDLLAAQRAPENPPASGVRARYVPFHRSRLVGREPELLALTSAIDRARSGGGGLQIVSGESGIGKTRLLNEATRYALERGFEVFVGHCRELLPARGANPASGRALGPFLPLLAWVADQRRSNPAAWEGDLATALAVLATYEPSLTDPTALAPPELPHELARARVLQSLAMVLGAASAVQPFLLVIDDVQWADDLSVAFLCGGHAPLSSIAGSCTVLAYRDDELSPELEAKLVARASGMIRLERLTTDEIALLSRSLLGDQVISAQVLELLQRRSGGNPFLVIEYLYSLREQGAELAAGIENLDIAIGLKELFEARVARLSPAARRVLELAAVVGAEFPSKLLEVSATRLDSNLDVKSAIWELGAQRLLASVPEGRYRFVHDKLREAQLSALSPTERRALHRQAAELLIEADEFSATSAELGLHLAEAGLPEQALTHLRDAAERAAESHSNADAAELYALALRQVASMDTASTSQLSLELSEARGDVLLRSGRNREATEQYASAMVWASTATRARLFRKQATALRTAHDYPGAADALEGAERALSAVGVPGESGVASEWIEIQQSRFWLHYFERQGGPVTEAVVNRMRPVVERYGTPLQRSRFFECAASHLLARDRYLLSGEALELARRAVSELSDGEHAGQVAGARFVLAFSLRLGSREHCREAVDLFEKVLVELDPIGDPLLISRALVYRAVAERRLGLTDAVGVTTARARLYAERAQLTPYIGACLACDAWLSWKRGDIDEGERLAREAASSWQKSTHVFPFRWLASFVLLDIHHLRDDFSSAALVLDELLDVTQQRFDERLATALSAARNASTQLDAREASRKLLAVLQLAHGEGYL